MYGSDQRSVAHCLGKHYADITQHFPRPALVARTFLGGGGEPRVYIRPSPPGEHFAERQ